MKVVHVPFCFYPDPVGGTEIYVGSLARKLTEHGAKMVIAAPGETNSAYEIDGLRVRRFAVSEKVNDIRELYGAGDEGAAKGVAQILDDEQPDIVHLHAFTRGASLKLVREARQRGIKIVFTYHTPTVSCQRGTLLRWGVEICDGKLDLHGCSACTLHKLGLNKTGALILGSLPKAIGRLAGFTGRSGGTWTALRMPELVDLRHSTFRALMQEVDQVVALCQWGKDLLIRNGVPADKITLSRHGLPEPDEPIEIASTPLAASANPLRIIFLGRLDNTKGPDTLIRAVRSSPDTAIELHLYGITQSVADRQYLDKLKQLAGDDSRIRFLPKVDSKQVVSLLRNYHLLAVPSRGLETGPLVVLEAFAAGIPVIGSNLGGIAELVQHELNGLLVETDSVAAWRQAIQRCDEDRAMLEQFQKNIQTPRSMDVVADEMQCLYESLLQNRTAHQTANFLTEKIHAHR